MLILSRELNNGVTVHRKRSFDRLLFYSSGCA